MGAYAPVKHISEAVVKEATEKILLPAATGMVRNGTPFTGILYAGVMATDDGPKTIEFNARFGDPETQVLMNRLESDLAEAISAILNDQEPGLVWKQEGISLGVVVASKGYPEAYEKYRPLDLPEIDNQMNLYFAGVSETAGKLVSNGGRVYLVEAAGETIEEAQEAVYSALEAVDTSEYVYRKDIGNRAVMNGK